MFILFEIGLIAIVGIVFLSILSGGKFFSALKNRSIAAADDAANAVRDPVADGKVAIAQAKAELTQIRNDRRDLLVEIKNQEQELADLNKELEKWELIAVAAGKAKNAENVRRALARKKEVQTDIEQVSGIMVQYQNDTDTMNKAIEERETEINTAERDSKRLAKSIKFETFRQSRMQDKLGESPSAESLRQLRQDAAMARARSSALEEEARMTGSDAELEKTYFTPVTAVSDDDIAVYIAKE